MKKYLKTALAGLLAASMALSLAGCGKGGKGEESAGEKKEFYYVPQYQDMKADFDYISEMTAVGDDLYLFAATWDEETGEGSENLYKYDLLSGERSEVPVDIDENSSIQCMSVDSKGDIVMIVSRYEQIGGSTFEEGEGTDGGDDASSDSDGTDTAKGAGGTSQDGAAEDADGEEELSDEEGEEITERTESVVTSVAGGVAVEGGATASFYVPGSSYEEVEYENHIELWKISAKDGSVLSKTDIKPVFDNPENSWIQYMVMDGEDHIYISSGDSGIYVLDEEGNKLFNVAVENWIQNLFATKEGEVYLKSWGTEDLEVRRINPKTKALDEPLTSKVLNGDSYNQEYYPGRDKGLIISDGNSVSFYDFEADQKEEQFVWLDADIDRDTVSGMGQLSDGRFWAVLRDYYSSSETSNGPEYSLVYLTKTPASEVQEKEEIFYGVMYLTQQARRAIIDFNKANDQYHISVKDYEPGDYEQYAERLTQFNNDITSGNGPDIVDISNIDFQQYAEKGVFEDLYPFMEKDGIRKEDYLENILKAYETDGKLYGLVPQFYISTVIAKSALVGTQAGWTLSEMLDFAEKHDAADIFRYGSRSSIFYYCIYNNIDEFIDWETGECKFSSDDFIRVLEFAAKYPEEPDYNREEGTSSMIRNDRLLLMQDSLSSTQEYQMMKGMFGEEITYIGYPNNERKGNLIQATNLSLAISSKSKHKDGAWEFVKTLISDKYQDSMVKGYGSGWGFPLKKSALEKQFEIDSTPEYYEDENGEKVERMKTSWGYDDFDIDIYAATKEEIDTVRSIIASAEKTAGSVNEELITIITEETEAYFKGQKSGKETADIIQNRIQTYVNEHS